MYTTATRRQGLATAAILALIFSTTPASAQDGSWTLGAPVSLARVGSAGAAIDGLFYVAGGTWTGGPVEENLLEVYDPLADVWTVMAPMPTRRSAAGAVSIDGKLYVAGGYSSGSGWLGGYRANLEVYDPLTNVWTVKAPMPAPRNNVTAAAAGGKLYVFGGDYAGNAHTNVFAYDPVTDAWQTLLPMPVAKNGAVAVTIAGEIYVVGGSADSTLRIYDPAADTWSTGAAFPVPGDLVLASAGTIDGKLYVAGGYSIGSGYLNNLEVYDPLTNVWTEMTPLAPPPAFYWAAHAVLDGKLHIASGLTTGGVVGTLNIYTPPSFDSDGDGVSDQLDVCSATLIPEDVPTKKLNPNHWALTDNNLEFDTVIKGKGPGLSYTTTDTAGCSCEQIIEAMDLDKGHMKHGCSIGAMDDWFEIVNP